jgi:hypothetical protein
MNDWSYDCTAKLLADAIVAVAKPVPVANTRRNPLSKTPLYGLRYHAHRGPDMLGLTSGTNCLPVQ